MGHYNHSRSIASASSRNYTGCNFPGKSTLRLTAPSHRPDSPTRGARALHGALDVHEEEHDGAPPGLSSFLLILCHAMPSHKSYRSCRALTSRGGGAPGGAQHNRFELSPYPLGFVSVCFVLTHPQTGIKGLANPFGPHVGRWIQRTARLTANLAVLRY